MLLLISLPDAISTSLLLPSLLSLCSLLTPPLSLLPPCFLIQAKSRLDLSTQTAKQNYQKELDARDEELDKIRSTMNKRVRSLEASLEEEHSERQSAVKVRRTHTMWLQNCVCAWFHVLPYYSKACFTHMHMHTLMYVRIGETEA